MSLKEIGNKIFDKEVELSSEAVELGAIDDIISAVRANATGRDKARPLIRGAFSDLAKALEILERIPKRTDKIEKTSNKLKAQIKELGISEKELPQQIQFAVGGSYTRIGREAESEIKALRSALGGLKKSSEV
jgi:hypothetical protein